MAGGRAAAGQATRQPNEAESTIAKTGLAPTQCPAQTKQQLLCQCCKHVIPPPRRCSLVFLVASPAHPLDPARPDVAGSRAILQMAIGSICRPSSVTHPVSTAPPSQTKLGVNLSPRACKPPSTHIFAPPPTLILEQPRAGPKFLEIPEMGKRGADALPLCAIARFHWPVTRRQLPAAPTAVTTAAVLQCTSVGRVLRAMPLWGIEISNRSRFASCAPTSPWREGSRLFETRLELVVNDPG